MFHGFRSAQGNTLKAKKKILTNLKFRAAGIPGATLKRAANRPICCKIHDSINRTKCRVTEWANSRRARPTLSLSLSLLVMIIHRARENPEVKLPPSRTESYDFINLRLAALQVAAIVRRE